MGALMRAHDWRSSSLGDPADWPAPLRTALGVILNTDPAAEVSRRRPNLKILLTTGYAAGLISNPSKDVHVLRKPYDIRSLELALRTVLADKAP